MTTVSTPAVDALQKRILAVQAQFNEAAISNSEWSQAREVFERTNPGIEAFSRDYIMTSLTTSLKSIIIKPTSWFWESGLPSQGAFNDAEANTNTWDEFAKTWKAYVPVEARPSMEKEKSSMEETTSGWSVMEDPRKVGIKTFKDSIEERFNALKKYTAIGVPTVVIVIGVVAGLVILGAAYFQGLQKRAIRAGAGGR